MKDAPFEKKSRAVLRIIEPGLFVRCARCDEPVKFISAQKVKPRQVICNVYVDGVWSSTAHFHETCYTAAGEPYGVPDKRKPMRT